MSYSIFFLTTYMLLAIQLCSAQRIHPLEPVSAHYRGFQVINPAPNMQHTNLDAIRFPLDGRTSGRQYIGLEPTYLRPDQVGELVSGMSMPANSSAQTRAELDYLLQLQEARTPNQRQRAMAIARIGYWPPSNNQRKTLGYNSDHLFWEYEQVFGNSINPADYPATLELLAGVMRDMRIMEFTVKYELLRARPYQLEPRLDPMARISSPSFASGHTLWAYIQAFTWSELLPEKRQAFIDLAFEVGHSREIMGIHYPSDEEAARVLAHAMLVAMMDQPAFRNDLERAKLEWD